MPSLHTNPLLPREKCDKMAMYGRLLISVSPGEQQEVSEMVESPEKKQTECAKSYEDVKAGILELLAAYRSLSPKEQLKLAEEFLGPAKGRIAHQVFRKHFS